MSAELLALAERCEAATGADRELDWSIFPGYIGTGNPRIPRYTASLDAAMGLVPEGWDFEVGRADDVTCYATVWLRGYRNDYDAHFSGTPALALCASALRARAAEGGAS